MTQAQAAPTRTRALMCLLLNVIVFPGLGTLASGQAARRKTGVLQLGLGFLLIPILLLATLGASLGGMDPEVAKTWLGNVMLVLVIWNIVTGVQIFRDSLKKPPEA